MKLEIHNMAGHLVRRINQISTSVFHEQMKRHGHDLTPVQFAALNAVGTYPDIDQASLAKLIAYDRPTIGGVVDRLEAKGLVTRVVARHDRRAREVNLTQAGRALLEEVTPLVRALQPDILCGLTPDEREEFLRLATKLADAGNRLSRAPLERPEGEPTRPLLP